MSETGESIASFSISNNRDGADTLMKGMLETARRKQSPRVQIGMEATSNLGWHLAHYLQDQLVGYEPDIKAKIYFLNARKVARFKKGDDSFPKNDRVDAWVIADQLRFGRLPYMMKDSVHYEALQRLTRTRYHLMLNVTRDKTYFLNQVFLKFSGIRQDNPFSNTFGATCLAVIQELEPEQIVQMSIEELIHFLQVKGKNRFENPEETAEYLKKLARSSLHLHKTLQDPVNIALSATLGVIQHMEGEIKKLDKEIAKLMKVLPETHHRSKASARSMLPVLLQRLWILHGFQTIIPWPSTPG